MSDETTTAALDVPADYLAACIRRLRRGTVGQDAVVNQLVWLGGAASVVVGTTLQFGGRVLVHYAHASPRSRDGMYTADLAASDALWVFCDA